MPNPNHEDKESLIEPLEGLLIDLDFTLYYTKDLVYGGGSEYVLANQHLKDKFQQALTLATERAVRERDEEIKNLVIDVLAHKDDYDVIRGDKYLNETFANGYNRGISEAKEVILSQLTKE